MPARPLDAKRRDSRNWAAKSTTGASGARRSMLLIPHQPLVIEYSPGLQKSGRPALTARCAKVLGYEIVEQASVAADVGSDSTYVTPRAAA